MPKVTLRKSSPVSSGLNPYLMAVGTLLQFKYNSSERVFVGVLVLHPNEKDKLFVVLNTTETAPATGDKQFNTWFVESSTTEKNWDGRWTIYNGTASISA